MGGSRMTSATMKTTMEIRTSTESKISKTRSMTTLDIIIQSPPCTRAQYHLPEATFGMSCMDQTREPDRGHASTATTATTAAARAPNRQDGHEYH